MRLVDADELKKRLCTLRDSTAYIEASMAFAEAVTLVENAPTVINKQEEILPSQQ